MMDFDELDAMIPRNVEGDLHANTIYVASGDDWSVRVKYPGKHKDSTGDFVIEVMSKPKWNDFHQFTHGDLFQDVHEKFMNKVDREWFVHVLRVTLGNEPPRLFERDLPGIHIDALTHAMLALAVCEYRRYPKNHARGGGKLLPLNYMMAVLAGHWHVDDAVRLMRKGLPALRSLDDFVPFTPIASPDEYVDALVA